MSAGTITLTNGSAIVGGAGTSFATEIAAGDFIVSTVGGVAYTLPVKSVESNTQLTLVSNFTGPTQSGAAWSAVPRVALNMVTAALVAQSAEALRGLNYDKQNWQQVYGSAGNITVKLPDGTTFTGPSWKYLSDNMATKSGGAVPVNQGGTGSTTASGARTNLGLGSSATRNVYSTSGDMLSVGDFGVGAVFPSGASIRLQDGSTPTGFYGSTGDGYSEIGVSADLTTLTINRGNRPTRIHQSYSLRRTWFSYYSGSAWTYHEGYTTGNTTKASDGTLKAASPVARIVKSQEESQRTDIDSDGFNWCGCGTANDEAEGINISRLDVGVYVLTGSAGLASEGWQLLPPMDPGGMGELGIVEAEQGDDGKLTIRLFKRKYILNDEGEMVKTKGGPIDVPLNSWIDVRLDMHEDSIWGMKVNAAAQEASGD